MHVRVDAAGDDDLTRGVNQAAALRQRQRAMPGKRHDASVLHADVIGAHPERSDHPIAADHQVQCGCHGAHRLNKPGTSWRSAPYRW